MTREDWFILVMWGIIIGGILALLFYAFTVLVDALGDIIVAVIGAGAILIGAILTHALTEVREQRILQQREMQKNYLDLIENIDVVIRNPNLTDEFAKIHLMSWAVGSARVIEYTQRMFDLDDNELRTEYLLALLLAIRDDIGFRRLPKKIKLRGPLFQPKKETYLKIPKQ